MLKRLAFSVAVLAVLTSATAHADYRITRDHGGLVDEYKAKYTAIRDRGERVIIDGICNSACTLVLGIVPYAVRTESMSSCVAVVKYG